MPSNTLILVHGMGTPTDEMFEEWEEGLRTNYEKYSEGETFNDRFECVHLEYDSIFEGHRDQWDEMVTQILESGVGTEHLPTQSELEEFTGDNFFTTHIQDVLLYRFVSTVNQQVRAHVLAQLIDKIQESQDGQNISILAHSLGTAVIHDAVNDMYATPLPDGTTFPVEDFRFSTIAQIANVSRTLMDAYDPYRSWVKPGAGLFPDAATHYFLSASHRLDPLSAVRAFDPGDDWPDPETVADQKVSIVKPRSVTHWNVHDFLHYINDPVVHLPLFRMLTTPYFISDEDKRAAEDAYDAAAIHPVPDKLLQLMDEDGDDDPIQWKKLVKLFKHYYGLIED